MSEWTVRRVDWRRAPEADLVALWEVESEVDALRRPDRPRQILSRYLEEARSLPPSYREWTWLVEDAGGAPVAHGTGWFREGDDARIVHGDAGVVPAWRGRGVGWALARLVCDAATEAGRTLLVGFTTDGDPAGEAFARRLGMTVGQVNRTSELRLDTLDWAMVERWADEGPGRAPGYRLELVEGAYPDEWLDAAVTLAEVMETAPHDDIDVEPATHTREQVRQRDAFVLGEGQTRWTLFALDASGACVGGTSVYLPAWDEGLVFQDDTGVHPDHRGHALGKWLKAAMLLELRRRQPGRRVVTTGNAYSNAPMLGINDALGFRIVRTNTDWQAPVATVRAALEA